MCPCGQRFKYPVGTSPHFQYEVVCANSSCHLGSISISEWICCLWKLWIERMAVTFAFIGSLSSYAYLMTVFTECPHRNESIALRVPPIHCRIFGRMDVEQVSVVAMETIRLQRTNSKLAVSCPSPGLSLDLQHGTLIVCTSRLLIEL